MKKLLSLPKELQLKVLSYLSYDEISKLRLVSVVLNNMCMDALNMGLNHVENLHAAVMKEIKKQLPKRESERRMHPLSRHTDILSAIETRMSLLQITYSKHIESGYCCFIPGKVLDELIKILILVRVERSPPRAHEVLMELRDISSMAMEHFEEKILPGLKKRVLADGHAVLPIGLCSRALDGPGPSLRSYDVVVKRTSADTLVYPTPKRRKISSSCLSTPLTSLSGSMANVRDDDSLPANRGNVYDRLADAERYIAEQGALIDEQARHLEDMNKKLTDYNHRFNDLTEVLRLHFSSGNVHDKLAALVRASSESDLANCAGESNPGASDRYTQVVAKRQVTSTGRKPAVLRAQHLKEQIDLFRDECKL